MLVVNCMITGDGADQVFSGVSSANYLPLVGAIMRDQEMGYVSPFFDQQVVSYGEKVSDANKSQLRTLGVSLLPEFLHHQKKQPRLAPAFNLEHYWRKNAINWVSEHLNIRPNLQTDASKTLWTTLGMLVEHVFGTLPCVA